MNKRLAFRLATISGLTIGSFLGGITFERKRCITLFDQTNNPYLLYASDDLKKVSFLLRRFGYSTDCVN